MSEEDFDSVFECGRCQCKDEVLDWVWDEDLMKFTAECSCFKTHKLTPLKCKVSVESETYEEDED